MKFSFIFPRALLKQFSPFIPFLFLLSLFNFLPRTLFNWILWLLNEATLSAVCHVYIVYIWWWYSMHICTEINVAKCQLWLNWKWTIKVQYWYWMCKRKKKKIIITLSLQNVFISISIFLMISSVRFCVCFCSRSPGIRSALGRQGVLVCVRKGGNVKGVHA